MADLHLQRMAHVLVNYSIGVKKGERLGIRAPRLRARWCKYCSGQIEPEEAG